MNINAIRDADASDPGFYAAACAADPAATWKGAVLYVSGDGGANYAALATLTSESTMGVTTTALGDFHSGNIPDELNKVNVRLSNGSLSSTDTNGLLSGSFAFVIGREIIFGRNATLQTDGSYTLRGFLRGQRGTEYAMVEHAVGDRFILLDARTLVRVAQDTSAIGIEKLYKGVSAGRALASATAKAFTNEGTGLKPYAPVHLGGGRNASNDVILTWVRRNRIDGSWRNGVDVPMSEATEAYEVEIYADGTFATVIRTITGITSQTTTYLASDQTSDGLTPGDPVYFKVYQLSAVVGRGHAASGSV